MAGTTNNGPSRRLENCRYTVPALTTSNRKFFMKKSFYLLSLVFAFHAAEGADLKLWYNSPGANGNYSQSMLIGNGRMGGLMGGQVVSEQIYLNDSSLWTGTANPSGNYDEPNPTGFGAYQYFGTLNLNNSGQSSYSNYYREMDIQDAIARVSYSVGSTNYNREYFCSHPDDVMVIHLTSSASGAYSGTLSYSDVHSAAVGYTSTNITASGTLGGSGIQWGVNIRVINSGGTLTAGSGNITYTKCDSLTIVVSVGTSYVMNSAVNFLGPNPLSAIAAKVANAAAKSYNSLTNAHVADYQSLFNRVTVNLGQSSPSQDANPTDTRIASAATTLDPELESLMFQNGRYLLISSSRPGTLPPNLQGLWTITTNAPWGSDYHTDINIQMCMWAAETANLPECHQPLMDLINSQLPVWRQQVGGLDPRMTPNGVPRGWTVRVSHNTVGGQGWNWNQPGNAWYCLHYWEHYLFSGDTNYLATNAYPVMKESCEFWQDCLTNVNGLLEAPYCWSPEHGNWENGVSYDQELIWNLFNNYVQASEILGVDSSYRVTVAGLRDQLLRPKIGSWGQLQEWVEDIDGQTDNHRHTSHLIALFPAADITPDQTPVAATAAKVSLIARGETGDSSTEWANVWRTALWARLGDGELAHHRLSLLFADHEVDNNFVMYLSPDQWDGTFGITASMIETLLQSHEGIISLLPALPSAWPYGSVTGLRARGGFTVDLSWTNGWLTSATIHSVTGTNCTVRYGSQTNQFNIALGGSAQFTPSAPGNPLPPTLVTVTTITNTTVVWTPSNVGLCTYNVKYASNPAGPFTTLASGVHGTYYITTVSTNNYFVVSTVRNGVESANSAVGYFGSGPSSGIYRIINRNSGLALDAKGQWTTNDTPIQQYTYNGGDNQLWTVDEIGGGQYVITGVQSGRVADVKGQSTANGALIQLYDYNGGPNQEWIIAPTNNTGYCTVQGLQSSKMMEVSGSATTNGATVDQWTGNGGFNQQWSFQFP
jgi:alpha-L-fucosidase 2